MMLLDLVAVGKVRSREISALAAEFAKRLGGYARLKVTELADGDVASEGRAICRELDRARGAKIVVLGEEGKLFSTSEFAAFLKDYADDAATSLFTGFESGTTVSGEHATVMNVANKALKQMHDGESFDTRNTLVVVLMNAEVQCHHRLGMEGLQHVCTALWCNRRHP